jgi:secretion/DNA translocation related TadE-like protein
VAAARRVAMDRRVAERGAASLFAVALTGLLVLVGAALGVAGAMVHAHRVAQSAVDLAALAGAQAASSGGDACADAGGIAEANGARLDACVLDGADVRVTVTVPGPRWLGQPHDLSAQARAGPAD